MYQFYQLKPAVCCFKYPKDIGQMYLAQYPTHMQVRFQLNNLLPGAYTLNLHEFGDESNSFVNLGQHNPMYNLGKVIIGPSGIYNNIYDYNYPFSLDQIMGRSIVLKSDFDGKNIAYGIVGHSAYPVF
jgi:hypothetical protein